MQGSVTADTSLGYQSGIKHWQGYYATLPASSDPGLYMELCPDNEHKVFRLVHYHQYLYHSLGMREGQVVRAQTCLRHHLLSHMETISWMDDRRIKDSKTACARSPSEQRVHAELQRGRLKLPMSLETMWAFRSLYFEGRSFTSKEDWDARSLWIAGGWCCGDGTRIGSWTLKDGPKKADHAIRTNNCVLEVSDGHLQEPQYLAAGSAYAAYMAIDGHNPDENLLSATITYDTGKTTRNRTKPGKQQYWGRRNPGEATLLQDLGWYLSLSGVLDGDELLTRYWTDKPREDRYRRDRNQNFLYRKVVTRKAVTDALKDACQEVGLDPADFTSKSLRKCFASHVTAEGMSREERNGRGGWSLKTTTVEDHYVSSVETRGAFAIGQDNPKLNSISVKSTKKMQQAKKATSAAKIPLATADGTLCSSGFTDTALAPTVTTPLLG
jgi:hypothetical protein